ncbi:hypothetical protein GJ744_008788 [Endocarpon pusillum]|uniref:Uncharacterized protein n=1 Tax=Endocarpon pusillum TaxID=364733 RepID=A0A8H7ASE2_9EURO|nr:hypothetical protein GJ744_002035 [Endocarpon pusillum]KAF7513494.1 hypothetical protein GJ744_008788 [Endocarpon pusillum]
MVQKRYQEEISGPTDTIEAAPLAKDCLDPKEHEFRAEKLKKIKHKVSQLKYFPCGLLVRLQANNYPVNIHHLLEITYLKLFILGQYQKIATRVIRGLKKIAIAAARYVI